MSLRECSQVRQTDGGGSTDVKMGSGLWASMGGHHGLPVGQCPLTRSGREVLPVLANVITQSSLAYEAPTVHQRLCSTAGMHRVGHLLGADNEAA